MFTGLMSFLGGSVFRMIWGEVSAYMQKKQEHAQQMAMMQLQSGLEAQRHDRDMARIQLQNDLGVKNVIVQTDATISKAEVEAWAQAVKDVGRITGIKFLDAWNGAIRPALATLAILVILAEIVATGFILSEYHKEIVAAILGIYIADRSLTKRGK